MQELVPHTDTGDAALESAACDFGGIVHARPSAVIRPRCAEEIADVVRYARAHGMKIAARGVGHSAGGQAQVDGGLVIDMSMLNRIHRVDLDARYFDADAGARWTDVMSAVTPLGWTPPVVTDWQHLTVGGTLCVGGVGSQSFHKGIQTDAVIELQVVTGTGELVVCSRTRNQDLFDAVRAGLGQFGIVVRVRMRIEPAPSALTLHHLVYDDLGAFFDDVEKLVGERRFDALLAHAVPNRADALAASIGAGFLPALHAGATPGNGCWLYDLEAVHYHGVRPAPVLDDLRMLRNTYVAQEFSWTDYIHRSPPIVERDKREGMAPHPQFMMVVPGPAIRQWAARVMAEVSPESMGGGPVLLIPIARDAALTPLLRAPDTPLVWLFGLIPAAPDAKQLAGILARNLRMYPEARAAGAYRYPCDSLPLPRGSEGWADHFGPLWERVLDWKKRFDPDHLFAPRLMIFDSQALSD